MGDFTPPSFNILIQGYKMSDTNLCILLILSVLLLYPVSRYVNLICLGFNDVWALNPYQDKDKSGFIVLTTIKYMIAFNFAFILWFIVGIICNLLIPTQ